jgi:chitodextrinase
MKRLILIVVTVAAPFSIHTGHTQSASVPFDHVVIDHNGPSNMHSKAVGDINGDGFPDLVVAGTGGTIYWYADPSWVRHTVTTTGGRWSDDIEVADVNRDGRNDLVVSDWYQSKRIGWFQNPGTSGSWVFRVIGSPEAHDIEVGDLDGDGDVDIVTRHQWAAGNKIEIWRQNSPTSWTRRTLACPEGEGLQLGDLDEDGDPDIIIGGRWYENTGDVLGGPWTQYIFATNWTHQATFPAIGDINGDGRPDVVLTPTERAGTTYRTSWYQAPANPKSSGWTERVIQNSIETVTHSLGVADMDGDGDLDVVNAEMHQGGNPDEVRVYLNGGSGSSWVKQVISTAGSHNIRVADLGNDGDYDVFGANWSTTTQVDLWENLSAGGALDTSAPSMPANLSASPASSTQINLAWSASSDNVAVTGYRIIRNGTPIGTTTSTSYVNGSLSPSTTYSYQISAFDAAGNESGLCAARSATTPASDSTPPVISGVASTGVTATSATITWTTNEAATSRVDYGTSTAYGLSATTSGLRTSHALTVTNLAPSTVYHYRVTSTDGSGNTRNSSDFTFTTQAGSSGLPTPMAYWKVDESSGTSATDAAGSYHGTLMNGVTRVAGRLNGAVQFDGVNDYVALPNIDVAGSALTIAAWVRHHSFPTGGDQRILSKATDTSEQGHYWMLSQIRSGGERLRFRLRAGGTTKTLIASSGNLPLNAWYHAAATYDGTTMRLYYNGVQVGSTAKSGAIATNTGVGVNLGRNPDGAKYLHGALDDVRLYNRALTAAEINAVMGGN